MKYLIILISILCVVSPLSGAEKEITKDVCVYGATPSGILAALSVKREGKSVVIVEPGRWVGGMSGAGLKPMQDCPNINIVGGMSHELIKSLGVKGEILDYSQMTHGEMRKKQRAIMNKMSPKDVREDYLKLLKEKEIKVVFEHRVSFVLKEGAKITEILFDLAPFDQNGCPPARPEKVNHLSVKAGIFIDASYEGEIMPRAGVSYSTGRESKAKYGEKYAGVQKLGNAAPVDPFVIKGDPNSGLLKWVENDNKKAVGSGDHYTQAYNYRYYTTTNSKYKVPFEKPANYNPQDYELIGRYVQYLVDKFNKPEDKKQLAKQLSWIFPGNVNSGEHNYARWDGQLFSQAPLGVSWQYADGDYFTKNRIWQMHMDYLRGMHAFMSSDSRVPEWHRQYIASLGRDIRHHPETNGWPHQLYIRLTRRLSGRYTLTEKDVYNTAQPEDIIGLGHYGVDTYPNRRVWYKKDGQYFTALEGLMFVGGETGPTKKPYGISYRSITPKSEECTNLLVPVCFSSSYVGYASARMENVFMVLGESAGIAACMALDKATSVQELKYSDLKKQLLKYGQVIDPDAKGLHLKK